jgi:hypothetical protein
MSRRIATVPVGCLDANPRPVEGRRVNFLNVQSRLTPLPLIDRNQAKLLQESFLTITRSFCVLVTGLTLFLVAAGLQLGFEPA